MSTRIRVIEANDFIKATPDGSLDLEESKRRLRAIAVTIDPVVNYDAMLDTRQARSGLSLADLWYLAAELNVGLECRTGRPGDLPVAAVTG